MNPTFDCYAQQIWPMIEISIYVCLGVWIFSIFIRIFYLKMQETQLFADFIKRTYKLDHENTICLVCGHNHGKFSSYNNPVKCDKFDKRKTGTEKITKQIPLYETKMQKVQQPVKTGKGSYQQVPRLEEYKAYVTRTRMIRNPNKYEEYIHTETGPRESKQVRVDYDDVTYSQEPVTKIRQVSYGNGLSKWVPEIEYKTVKNVTRKYKFETVLGNYTTIETKKTRIRSGCESLPDEIEETYDNYETLTRTVEKTEWLLDTEEVEIEVNTTKQIGWKDEITLKPIYETYQCLCEACFCVDCKNKPITIKHSLHYIFSNTWPFAVLGLLFLVAIPANVYFWGRIALNCDPDYDLIATSLTDAILIYIFVGFVYSGSWLFLLTIYLRSSGLKH